MRGHCWQVIPIIANKPLHLASSSPRRREILAALGLGFSADGPDIDESRRAGEPAAAMVVRLASEKARAAEVGAGTVVLAADTAVVLGDELFGKPGSRAEALDTLARLSGRTHQVLTGVAMRLGRELHTGLAATDVRFREVGPDEALAYWQSGEPADKAGAYAIQGRGGAFVDRIRGSYSNVVGLPVVDTVRLLQKVGFEVFESPASAGSCR